MSIQHSKQKMLDDYITVAERIAAFYQAYPMGRICTHIIEHDVERGFILMRAEGFRNPDDAMPAATGHAFELRNEGYVNRTSYIENCESSCVGRMLALLGFEVKRGMSGREETGKPAHALQERIESRERNKSKSALPIARDNPVDATLNPDSPATDKQKEEILVLLEELRPEDRRSQRTLLMEITGKQSRDELTNQEAVRLIDKLKKERNQSGN